MATGSDAVREQLEQNGLINLGEINYNLTTGDLYEHALTYGEGMLTEHGALLVNSAPYTGRRANDKFVKSEQVDRILRNVDVVTSDVARQGPPLLADARHTMTNAKRLSDTVGSEAQQKKIERIVDDTATLVSRANAATADAQAVVAQMRRGRGTVGALLMDEQLFDDLQEMVRDLKHNPWKFFWRE
ncbi:MAG: phosphoenolpyruvate carboxykinase (ATP) [Candidatus Kapabacteria bacterium]|nr:phosphoenolpyruvate carboxykinase (ATP) [Candidatus Kapabacteria bacterium]